MKRFRRFVRSLTVMSLIGLLVFTGTIPGQTAGASVAHSGTALQPAVGEASPMASAAGVNAAGLLQTVSPFDVTGYIQKATLDAACSTDVFCGGTLQVNGITITVPKNTLFQFPATSMTWQEAFKLAPAPYGLSTPAGSPAALDDNAKVARNTISNTINVLANDNDPGGYPISISGVTQAAHGTVSIGSAGASAIYSPSTDFSGGDSFTYTISNGVQSATGNVNVTVGVPSAPPAAAGDTATVPINSSKAPINVLANDSDPGGFPITVLSATQAAHGATTVGTGGANVLYTPASGFTGSDRFSYTATSGPLTVTASVTITVSAANTAPSVADDSAIVLQGSSNNSIAVLANDSDAESNPLFVTSVSQGANGSTSVATSRARVIYTPNFGFAGTDTFTYSASDGELTASGTVTVTVRSSLPQTGLALTDAPEPFAAYEVRVMGNRVRSSADDKYVAGLIFLSQQSLNIGQGFINAIDYATGELWVGSTPGARTGARVRLNTPKGRYGKPQSPDARFTSDEDNPTVHASTGYPMCIPRTDPAVADDALCPQRNRPIDAATGGYRTMFTMPASPVTSPPGPSLGPADPDATQQAPFEVGDYINYSGTLAKDPACTPSATNNCQYISAHTLSADLGIFTAPGVMPAYLAIEVLLLGVGGIPNPLFPQEAAEKLVVEAVSTDHSQLVDIFAVDVDACGNESHRFYASADPFGPPVGGVKGRARTRTVIGNFLPATREMRIASRTLTKGAAVDGVLATARTYANGLVAGQYRAPNFEFIFPENLVLGSPPVPFPFEEFPFLANGTGPYFGSGSNARSSAYGNLGQLNPWPGAAPQALGCGPAGVSRAPVANAGADQTVNSGGLVTLDGTASFDQNSPALPLVYTWLQTDGTAIALQNNGFARPYFTAPAVPAGSLPLVLTFSLVVGNGFTTSAIDRVSVTVVGERTPVVSAGVSQIVNSGTSVTLSGSAVDPNGSAGLPLTYQWRQMAGPAVILAGANGATASFTAPTIAAGQLPMNLEFQLTVTDNLGLSAVSSTTVMVQSIPDVVTITSAIWRLAQSKLHVNARSSVGGGLPVLTLHVPGQTDIIMSYDQILGGYGVIVNLPNPGASTITVTSSYGGSAGSPVTVR